MDRMTNIVVGGGAAGMMAALFSAQSGARTILLERNEKLGKKIYITGKGRCNVTNAAEDMDAFMSRIFRNPRFMYAAFAELDNRDLMALIEKQGVPLKVERGDRVFPESDRASDIINALKRAMESAGVEVRLNSRVSSLIIEDGAAKGVKTEDGHSFYSDHVILATGGVSYPTTGSTGDGHKMAEVAGHTVQKLIPALVPIETKESWPANLMGLSLKNVRLSAYVKGPKKEKCIYSEMGEMLFTHFGISGPLALTLSSLLPEDLSGVRLSIDLKPALDTETLDARLLRDFQQLSRKQLISAMDGLEPHSLAEQLLKLVKLSPAMPIHSVTSEQRRSILEILKNVPLTPKKLRDFNEAIITRGGINVKEVNPSTMESKLISGLYFAGEMLDVDATTGGFNLQIAFSTGALAGKCAGEA